ncbi:MAG: hypothetical protein ACK595_00120, partial [Planctomycetota bacterium]
MLAGPRLFAAFALVAVASAQARLTPETLAQLRRVGELALSPDGRHLLYTVRTPDLAQNRSAAAVWLLPTAPAGAAIEVGAGAGPVWRSATSYSLVQGGKLVTRSLQTDEEQELALPAGAGNVAWSPDGANVSFTRSVAVEPP